jgi:hypothetical protein
MTLTPLGRDVLAGKKDWQTINVEPRWLGGVEITPPSPWCWNPDTRRLVRTASRLSPPASRA